MNDKITQSKALREIYELKTDYNAKKDIRVKSIIKEALSHIERMNKE